MGRFDSPQFRRTLATRTIGYSLSILVGLGLFLTAGWGVPRAAIIVSLMKGKPTKCPLTDAIASEGVLERFGAEVKRSTAEVKVLAADAAFNIEKVHSADRDYWVKSSGDEMSGEKLIAYLLAEHRWVTRETPERQVKPGDIVIDCGAHVGVFTDKALRLGAAKVISVEIDPVNLECLRRNFAKEIAQGRVVVYPKGVWSKDGSMPFTVARSNSGMGSLVIASGSETIQVPITTLDHIVAELNLPKVDYIKMDIEGAEREALAGASATLAKYKPTLMLDFYHRPDDPVFLPRAVLGANPTYQEQCGPCEQLDSDFRPHVMYYR